MRCSHPLTSSQLSINGMLSRRPLGLQTVNRSGRLFLVPARKQPLSLAKNKCSCSTHQTDAPQAFDTGSGDKVRLPTQGESVVRGSGGSETMLQELPKPPADIDYLAVSPLSFLHRHFYCCQTFQHSLSCSLCRSSLQYSKAGQKILGSLGRGIWVFCTKT